MAEKKLTDWKQKAMENLSPTQIKALQMLRDRDADGAGVSDVAMNFHTRKSLEEYGMIRMDKNGRYWLLDAGYKKLVEIEASGNGKLPMPHEVLNVQPFVEAGLDNDDSPVVALTPQPPLPHGEGEQCDNDCDECVYREVVALISKKHPEVGELADALITQKKVLARLKLGE